VLAHIVPDAIGGPATYLNLVVACGSCNNGMENRLPIAWLRQTGQWPSFLTRLDGFSSKAGGKPTFSAFKKKLLCCEDEHEALLMVQNRTALQQTAWIAKLAQTLCCLRFGWPFNFKGIERRVTVIPGALTNAVSKRYKLYRLLGPPGELEAIDEKIKALSKADTTDDDQPEIKARAKTLAALENERDAIITGSKKRSDRRHHALDAMILAFLPGWMADPSRRGFFQFPSSVGEPMAYFRRQLDQLIPFYRIPPRPALEQTVYGAGHHTKTGDKVSLIRRKLTKLGYSGQPAAFSLKSLEDQAKKIIDATVRSGITDFVATAPKNGPAAETAWHDFLSQWRLPNGTHPRRVLCRDSDLVEFANLAKGPDPDVLTGAWRKGDQHRGYFVAQMANGRIEVAPVYVHARKTDVEVELRQRLGFIEIIGFFYSQCEITLSKDAVHGSLIISKGRYLCRSIQSDGRVKLTSAAGQKFDKIPLSKLIPCGFSFSR
jgi:CRISPR-associated endonuclease Csn1